MSRSDWSDLAKVVGLVGLACLFIWVLRDASTDTGVFDYRQDPKHQKHRAIADYCQRISETFIPSQPSGSSTGSTNQDDPKQRYDSCQQWRAAEASEKAAYFTMWQAIIALSAGFISILTLGAAVWAGNWARSAAKSTNKQAIQARRSTNAFVRAEGAQCFIEVDTTRLVNAIRGSTLMGGDPTPRSITVPLAVTNFGRSPALLSAVGFGSVAGDLDRDPTYRGIPIGATDILRPHNPHSVNAVTDELSRATLQQVRSALEPMHIFAMVAYSDVFTENHQLAVIWRYDPERGFVRDTENANYNMNT